MRKLMIVAGMLLSFGCKNEASEPEGSNPGTGGAAGSGSGGSSGFDAGDLPGTDVTVTVPATGRVFVDLDAPAVITPPNDGMDSFEWDIALSGWDVFTNSGPSGPGTGKAFGPLEVLAYFSDTPPEVPFLTEDKTGGAFLEWYDYDGAFHALYTRFHVYGVKRADKYYKVQILGYYGDVSGAPVSGIYSMRYAEVTPSGIGPTQVIEDIDGTAGGPSGSESAPSACVTLATGTVTPLAPDAAMASSDWDLCFRRTTISVNGELGGPGGVGSADLDGDKTAAETLAENQQKTADGELAHFDAVDYAALTASGVVYRGDRIVSAFSDHWVDPTTTPPTFGNGCWRVVGANGEINHMLVFTNIEGYSATAAGNVTLRVRSLQQ
jgi:hypothetical protein